MASTPTIYVTTIHVQSNYVTCIYVLIRSLLDDTHPPRSDPVLERVSKRSARLRRPWTRLDRHVRSCAYHQYALRHPATTSLIHEHLRRTAYFKTRSKSADASVRMFRTNPLNFYAQHKRGPAQADGQAPLACWIYASSPFRSLTGSGEAIDRAFFARSTSYSTENFGRNARREDQDPRSIQGKLI